MRVVSLVPSWTETLIWAGVEVVGRTGYCIHPEIICRKIPPVGGTKKIDWDRVRSLEPDLLILDREENTRAIAEESDFPLFISNILSVNDVAADLDRMAATLANARLSELANRWRSLIRRPSRQRPLKNFPGVIEWIREPAEDCHYSQLLYLIWQSPWITVSRDTFIGSVLEKLGYGPLLLSAKIKYPRITLEDFEESETLLLFATEPYPFGRKLEGLRKMGFPAALVDGEMFSWFGLRSLHFLERELGEE